MKGAMRLQGIVKWFSQVRGYGYISAAPGMDYWVHYSQIISDKKFRKLKMGDRINFTPMQNEKGYYAADVELIKEEVQS